MKLSQVLTEETCKAQTDEGPERQVASPDWHASPAAS